MKKFIYLTVVLMVLLMSLGCATVPPYTPAPTQELSSSVGNKPFVGEIGPEARGLGWWQMYGR